MTQTRDPLCLTCPNNDYGNKVCTEGMAYYPQRFHCEKHPEYGKNTAAIIVPQSVKVTPKTVKVYSKRPSKKTRDLILWAKIYE